MKSKMKLVLAEKPSMAQKIASALGKPVLEKGYYKVGNWIVTWAYGHLLEIDDSTLPKKWTLENLPIFPEKFDYKFRTSKTDPKGKKSKAQFQIIQKLLSQADELYIMTDMGREGENIARLILLKAGWNKWNKTYRPWTSDALLPEVIRRELAKKNPASKFDSLFWSAQARMHADFIVGINLTRAATLISPENTGVWSVGRVQTPTLKLIVERDLEIENFKPIPYWIIKATFQKDNITFTGQLELDSKLKKKNKPPQENVEQGDENSKFKIWNSALVHFILTLLKNAKIGIVISIEKKIKQEEPPLLHSLTTLQQEANKLYGFSAKKTHDLAQMLYENDLITYPRTESNHLSENEKKTVIKILQRLGKIELIPAVNKVGKKVFDSSKLDDDHGALIPVRPIPKNLNLSDDAKKIYNLILRRFLGVFMPPYKYENITAKIKVKGLTFTVAGKTDIELGWKSLYREEKKETKLPFLKKDDIVSVIKVFSEQKKTTPPPHYTDETLLSKMKKLNLGRPSTRDSFIDILLQRNYIVREGKKLKSTEKGKKLVERLNSSKIVSPEMTGEWEKKLDAIWTKKQGKLGYEAFMKEIKKFVKTELQNLLANKTNKSFADKPKF